MDGCHRQASVHHAPLHTAVINQYSDMLDLLKDHGILLTDERPEYLQVSSFSGLGCMGARFKTVHQHPCVLPAASAPALSLPRCCCVQSLLHRPSDQCSPACAGEGVT